MEVDLYKLALESDLFETLDSPKAQRLRLVTLFISAQRRGAYGKVCTPAQSIDLYERPEDADAHPILLVGTLVSSLLKTLEVRNSLM
jgi:hypothetical protein